LAYKELVEVAEKEQKHATYFSQITAQIYRHERDDGFDEANIGLQKVVSFYQKTETTRLDALAQKETDRQPTTELEWTNLICQPLNQLPRSDRSNSRGRKRQRNGSQPKKGPKTTGPSGTTPSVSFTNNANDQGQTAIASNSRTGISKNYKGNKPNPAYMIRPQQQHGGQKQGPQQHNNQRGNANNYQQQRHQTNNEPRRQESSYTQRRDEARAGPSRQPSRSSSMERMIAAITALKAAMQ